MKNLSKEGLIKSFIENPKFFYVYYLVLSRKDPNYKDLVLNEKSLNELLAYKSLYANKEQDDHKYNFTKNAFWNRSGFNQFLKDKLSYQ